MADIINLGWKLRNAKGQFVSSGDRGEKIQRIVREGIDRLSAKELNKMIRDTNKIIRNRYDRLDKQGLLSVSPGFRAITEVLSGSADNILDMKSYLKNGSDFPSIKGKIDYLLKISSQLDHPTMLVSGAKKYRDDIFKNPVWGDTSNLTGDQKIAIWNQISDILEQINVNYKYAELVEKYNNEVQDLIELVKQDLLTGGLEIQKQIADLKNHIIDGINLFDSKLDGMFNGSRY